MADAAPKHVGILGILEDLRGSLELQMGQEKPVRDERFTVTITRESLYLYRLAIIDSRQPSAELLRPREQTHRSADKALLFAANRIKDRLAEETRAR